MKIKTTYIKNKIKERNFNSETDRKYIEDLMYIERKLSMDASRWGYAGAMVLGFKKDEYTKEYNSIYKELNPKGFKKYVKVEQERKKERNEFSEKMRKEEVEELKEFKKMWKESGGKE